MFELLLGGLIGIGIGCVFRDQIILIVKETRKWLNDYLTNGKPKKSKTKSK